MFPYIIWLLFFIPTTVCGQDLKDSDKLGMAIEYFQSAKYHEALLILNKLDNKYKLNPRFKAYMGVCYFYEWDYKNACRYLDNIMDQLNVLAPQERTVYFFCSAESHFFLGEYNQAIPIYEKMLNVCSDNEKADAFYRLGFCYMYRNEWENAYDYFISALSYYKHFGCANNKRQRLVQIENMINGCKEHF